MLTANTNKNIINDIFKNVAIICFNYDRCIEFALHKAIQLAFAVDQETATECMKRLSIVHPYGTVGSLPWQDSNNAVPFGSDRRRDFETISQNISLFTEQRNDPDLKEFMDEHVVSSKKIMFLGFGYYQQNMQLIGRSLKERADIVGTAFKLSPSDCDYIAQDIKSRFRVFDQAVIDIKFENVECKKMMSDYSRFLAAI